MLKQLKVYGLEKEITLPDIDYDDWSNEVAMELAEHNLNFFNKLLISRGSLYRLSDLTENMAEIKKAVNTRFRNEKTGYFVSSVYEMYIFSNGLVQYSDINDSEDLIAVSHIKKGRNHYLGMYILNRIMNVVLSEKEIIETVSKELFSFGYRKLGNIALSEDQVFDTKYLVESRKEIEHALKYKFLSSKTMDFVKFLHSLSLDKGLILTMDFIKVKV